ncbi:MAG: stage III sporulation protein AA [Oscillibacter sp.]|nr:stage III sporulation protein AA [Oscillibacter sp.]MEA4994820.1 stage III sporulation protein AA [Oscillibacter sp.]
MKERDEIARYRQAAAFLPVRLRKLAETLPGEKKVVAEEFRLRTGRPMTVLLPEGESSPWGSEPPVEPEELETLCDLGAEFSRYAAAETLREGFLPVRGGFRIGFCGSAVMKGGVCTNLTDLSSANVRIAREKTGIAEELSERLLSGGKFESTLLLSPPGGGKTTLLRDLIRCASREGLRVGLADERGEVAVCYRGRPQMDVGPCTDVLDGCPKAAAIPMLLRTMNPQIVAADEITAEEDIRAMTMAAGCGVRLLATVHAADVEELAQRPLYRQLLETKVFCRAVCIRRTAEGRSYEVEELS